MPVAAPTHIEPHLPRVTLSPFVLRGALSIVVMVPGAGKADTVRDVLTSPPIRTPAGAAGGAAHRRLAAGARDCRAPLGSCRRNLHVIVYAR